MLSIFWYALAFSGACLIGKYIGEKEAEKEEKKFQEKLKKMRRGEE